MRLVDWACCEERELQLVVPTPFHHLYPKDAQLLSFADFIDEVKALQA